MMPHWRDALFPLFCAACGMAEGVWLCARCRLRMMPSHSACPLCHVVTPGGSPCADCAGNSSLARVTSVLAYERGSPAEALIRAWKYAFARDSERELFHFFRLGIADIAMAGGDVIVPVPLHPRRFAERGFNQSEVVGRWFSQVTGMPLLPMLRRVRYTTQQARLDRRERQKNLRGAFAPLGRTSAAGLHIVLVDDVYTTGATMQECARVLLSAGAAEVAGVTLARG